MRKLWVLVTGFCKEWKDYSDLDYASRLVYR
jgi:hypothetical protein